MTHPTTRMHAHNPSPPDPEAIALDKALDAWVAGDAASLDALDPMLGETVAQLYAWADVAGLPEEMEPEPIVAASTTSRRSAALPVPSRPPRHAPSPGPVRPIRLHPWRNRIMTGFSGLAAALLIGLSIYGAVPIFTDRQSHPTPSEIAFQAGTPAESTPEAAATATAPTREVPPELIFQGGDPLSAGGDQTVLPPVGTELTGAWGVDTLNPVRPEECSVTPMPREQAVTILTTPPSADQAVFQSDSTVDEATYADVQASFRQWQACRRSGNTFGAMALETDAFIRADFYDDGGAMALTYGLPAEGYSAETADGVLTYREGIDQRRAEISDKQAGDRAGSEGGLDLNLWIIDMQQAPTGDDSYIVPVGQFPAAEGGAYVWATAIWTNPNVSSEQPFPRVAVAFKLVNGVWKIDRWWMLEGIPPQGS